jgi:hypothetical protein
VLSGSLRKRRTQTEASKAQREEETEKNSPTSSTEEKRGGNYFDLNFLTISTKRNNIDIIFMNAKRARKLHENYTISVLFYHSDDSKKESSGPVLCDLLM